MIYGDEVEVPGDRLVFDGCDFVHIEAGTSIWGPTRWDGITFENCGYPSSTPPRCFIYGNINNVNWVKVINAKLSLHDASMTSCGQLSARDGATLGLGNYDYSMNDCGIYVEESVMGFTNSQIHDNGSSGLVVNYPSGGGTSQLLSTDIFNNAGSGVEIRNSLLSVCGAEGSNIYNNEMYGYLSLGTAPSCIVGGTCISNNGAAELIALYDSFPRFLEHVQLPFASIIDDNGYDESSDQYLLVAAGEILQPLDVTNLAVDTSVESRFFPSFDDYEFGSQQLYEAELIFACAFDSIYTENYEVAYTLMRSIIDDYPDTPTAKKAIPFLPYISLAMDGDPQELMDYLADIDNDALQDIITETEAVCMLSNQEFEAAIVLLEQIIDDPPSDEKQLLAELDEAYSYYKLATSGSRNLPEQCHRKPTTAYEYSIMRSEIIGQIMSLGANDGGSEVVPVLSLDSNYPNPFNPETTIAFSLATEGQVKLNIYNIRGQLVHTLVSESRPAGRYSEIWNGRNGSNQPVSSGIYFYQLKTAGKTLTKKMLLLK
ncbi:MAG: T9SS type A sorting domain-containing protein [Candidatus Cloacimonetes bacterium]|nr:T9SS type A sorting domain-containing protein [Candidatus Cloacimonadota bacterium]